MMWNWATAHLYYLLEKYRTKFCLCPENLSKADSKSNGSSCLIQIISRWRNTEATAWLLLIEVYENSKNKIEFKDKKYVVCRGRNMGKFEVRNNEVEDEVSVLLKKFSVTK